MRRLAALLVLFAAGCADTFDRPTITMFTASSEDIRPGEEITLTWATTQAKTCTLNETIDVPVNGTRVVRPPMTMDWVLLCRGEPDIYRVDARVHITVNSSVRIFSFIARPDVVLPGEPFELQWATENATSCSIDNGVGAVALSGKKSLTANASARYTLTCEGPSGPVRLEERLQVRTPVSITSFTATPASIAEGGESTLRWRVEAATSSCTIDNGVGRVGVPSGNAIVTPDVTTDYHLACPGFHGSTTATVTVTTTRTPITRIGGSNPSGASSAPSISADGRYVVFESTARNLNSRDTDRTSDVFIYDRIENRVDLISVSSEGVKGNGASRNPVISADGLFVAFESVSTNLLATGTSSIGDVYVHDRARARTTRVSRSLSAADPDAPATHPSISADGAFIAFATAATNIVANDGNGASDVFVYDRVARTNALVSAASNGTFGNGASWAPAISADGNIVAFLSEATNLGTSAGSNAAGVIVKDRASRGTTRISDGTEAPSFVTISPDAGWILYAGALAGGGTTIRVFERARSMTTNYGHVGLEVTEFGAAFSEDGSVLVYTDLPGIYLTTSLSSPGQIISVNANGMPAAGNSRWPAISANARYVAFESDATNLIENDVNTFKDVFVAPNPDAP